MTKSEIQQQAQLASSIVQQWPDWKRNILTHSLQPTNAVARTPVDNRVVNPQVTAVNKPADSLELKSNRQE